MVWPTFAVLTAIKSAHVDLNDATTILTRGPKRIRYYLAHSPSRRTYRINRWHCYRMGSGHGAVCEYRRFRRLYKSERLGYESAMIAGMLAILVIVFAVNRLVWTPPRQHRRYAE